MRTTVNIVVKREILITLQMTNCDLGPLTKLYNVSSDRKLVVILTIMFQYHLSEQKCI